MIIKEKNVFTNFAIYKISFTILIIRIETIKTIQHIYHWSRPKEKNTREKSKQMFRNSVNFHLNYLKALIHKKNIVEVTFFKTSKWHPQSLFFNRI
jgi:hypothetical protein